MRVTCLVCAEHKGVGGKMKLEEIKKIGEEFKSEEKDFKLNSEMGGWQKV